MLLVGKRLSTRLPWETSKTFGVLRTFSFFRISYVASVINLHLATRLQQIKSQKANGPENLLTARYLQDAQSKEKVISLPLAIPYCTVD